MEKKRATFKQKEKKMSVASKWQKTSNQNERKQIKCAKRVVKYQGTCLPGMEERWKKKRRRKISTQLSKVLNVAAE